MTTAASSGPRASARWSEPLGGALATGIALMLAAPPWNVAGLAWVAFAPLLRMIRDRPFGVRLAAGALAGVVWSVSTVWPWLFPATRAHLAASAIGAAAWTLVAAWLWGGMYLAILAVIHPRLPRPGWLSVPSVWVLGEAVRTRILGGAPWMLLGHTQHDLVWVRQLAELGGVSAIGFLVAMPSAALAAPPPERRTGLRAASAAIVVALAVGALRAPGTAAPSRPRSIHILSGENSSPDPVARYAAATRTDAVELTVWPEGATPGYLQEEPAARAQLAASARAAGWILTGARRFDGEGANRRYFNAAALIDPMGRLAGEADKQHLVPLVERSVLGLALVPRPFTAAVEPARPLDAGTLRVGALVCWDVVFPDTARALVAAGADVLANLSSDADLLPALPQLVAMAQFRAVETRRWVVRASGVGRSLAIDPGGTVIDTDRIAIGGPTDRALTLYVRTGEVVPWLALALLLVLHAAAHRERSGAPTSERADGAGHHATPI